MKPCNFPGRVNARRAAALKRVHRKANPEVRDLETDVLRERINNAAAGIRSKKDRTGTRTRFAV